jgi:integrase
MNIKKDTKNGTYYFVISAGFTSDGKRRQIKRTGFKTQKEAKEKYLQIQNELSDEKFVDPSSVTFETFLDKWKKRKQTQIEESTYIRYERLCRLHILPALGKMKLQKINTITVQNLIDSLVAANGFKRKSCLLVTTVVKDVFRTAIKEGLVKINPVQDIDLPKVNEVEMVIWDQDDMEVFLSIRDKKSRGKYYVAVLMALLTGMRKGEILGLSWDKIDFDNNIIHIQQILESDGSKISKKTKSKKFRQILIPDLLKHELILHKKEQKRYTPSNPDNLVFCTYRGKRVIPNTLNDV